MGRQEQDRFRANPELCSSAKVKKEMCSTVQGSGAGEFCSRDWSLD